jgi:hypothetical protein
MPDTLEIGKPVSIRERYSAYLTARWLSSERE